MFFKTIKTWRLVKNENKWKSYLVGFGMTFMDSKLELIKD